ncbi:MAG: RNA polymerase sigma factor SigZ [Chloroflexi bacterium]|nr:RNA polymerase sigma factor SigZ [Chloroflexota bacterium]
METIWTQFNAPLERFIRQRVPDVQAADDLLQDVYLKVHLNINTLRDDERLQSWVYQIARNAVYDYYRSRRPLDAISDEIAAPDDADDADDITRQLAESVRYMIELLPEGYREALLLADYDGLTQKELAERLGLSLSGAKSRVQRARRMLREMLLACCHFEFDRLGKVIDYYPHCDCCVDGG